MKTHVLKYAKSNQTNLEKIEDVELLRALEIGLKIKTLNLEGDSFSVDALEDYYRAKDKLKKDRIFKKYKCCFELRLSIVFCNYCLLWIS